MKFNYTELALVTVILLLMSASLKVCADDKPIIIIGGSYENGNVTFNDNLDSPLFGVNVAAGLYLDLGQAITRRKQLVVNEASAGDGTFGRDSYLPGGVKLGKWYGMDVQFDRAILRVATETGYNADYVVIGVPNDCLHSNAFGVPQEETLPCTFEDMNLVIDRLIAIGQYAAGKGITPVYTIYPKANNLDLALFGATPALLWTIDDENWNLLRSLHKNRIRFELPEAILVNAWKSFNHNGDGLHPDKQTVIRAARKIMRKIGE